MVIRSLNFAYLYVMYALRRLFGASEEKFFGELRAHAVLLWANSTLTVTVLYVLLHDRIHHSLAWIAGPLVFGMLGFNLRVLRRSGRLWVEHELMFKRLPRQRRLLADIAVAIFVIAALGSVFLAKALL